MDVVAMEIHETSSLKVSEGGAFTVGQDVQTRRREGLVQEVPGIQIKPVLGLAIDMFFHPLPATLGCIEIAFGPQVIKMLVFRRHPMFSSTRRPFTHLV
jgi:hypothetical protein